MFLYQTANRINDKAFKDRFTLCLLATDDDFWSIRSPLRTYSANPAPSRTTTTASGWYSTNQNTMMIRNRVKNPRGVPNEETACACHDAGC